MENGGNVAVIKNVAKKSTTKPPGFACKQLNGRVNSPTMPSQENDTCAKSNGTDAGNVHNVSSVSASPDASKTDIAEVAKTDAVDSSVILNASEECSGISVSNGVVSPPSIAPVDAPDEPMDIDNECEALETGITSGETTNTMQNGVSKDDDNDEKQSNDCCNDLQSHKPNADEKTNYSVELTKSDIAQVPKNYPENNLSGLERKGDSDKSCDSSLSGNISQTVDKNESSDGDAEQTVPNTGVHDEQTNDDSLSNKEDSKLDNINEMISSSSPVLKEDSHKGENDLKAEIRKIIEDDIIDKMYDSLEKKACELLDQENCEGEKGKAMDVAISTTTEGKDSDITKCNGSTFSNISNKENVENSACENGDLTDAKPKSEDSLKRPGSPENHVESKKCRLDSLVGKVETRVETNLDKENTNDVEMQSDTSEEVADGKLQKITKEKLNVLLAKKVKKAIKVAQSAITGKLQRQIEDLTRSNEAWKTQVAELKSQIEEITTRQLRQEKGRSATAKVATRNMGVQVDNLKVEAARQGLVKTVPSPNKTGARPPVQQTIVTAPVSISPASSRTMLIPVASTASLPAGQAVTLLAPSSNIGSQIRMIQAPNAPNVVMATANQPFLPGNQTVRQMLELKKQVPAAAGAAPAKAGGVIDLTDDDDGGKNSAARQVMNVAVTQQGVVRPALPITGIQPATFLLKQTTTGTPMILQPIANPQVHGTVPGTTTLMYTQPSAPVQGQSGTPAVRPTSAASGSRVATTQSTTSARPLAPNRTPNRSSQQHPAPLPVSTAVQKSIPGKPLPPRPTLKINRVQQGIVLSWNMTSTEGLSDITNYQLFAYQEGSAAPSPTLWKKVGDVKALPLPMACTLTQFQVGNKYHFAVRAVDSFGRFGDFSEASSIHLEKKAA